MTDSEEKESSTGSRGLTATLRRIIDSAAQEFSEMGFDRARIDTIATQAGVSRQLVYLYYGSKVGLYRAVADEAAELARTSLSRIDYNNAPVLAVLAGFIDTIFEYYGQSAAIMTIDTATHEAEWLGSASKVFGVSKEFSAKIAETLNRGKAEGLIDPSVDSAVFYASVPMIVTARVVMGGMSGLLLKRDFGTAEADLFWQDYLKEMLIRSVLLDKNRALPVPPIWVAP